MPTKIEWADETWNPVVGCRKVAMGCLHCYAEVMARRLAAHPKSHYRKTIKDGEWSGEVVLNPKVLSRPLHWKKPRVVFPVSMGDLFHGDTPFEYICAIFGVMAACPQHIFICLTKRAQGMLHWFHRIGAKGPSTVAHSEVRACTLAAAKILQKEFADYMGPGALGTIPWPLPNVWLGVSASTQVELFKLWPSLKQCPAAARILSLEPLLEEVSLMPSMGRDLDGVIVGGESGNRARECDVRWIRGIRDDCRRLGVSVFVKQLGSCVSAAMPDARDPEPLSWPGSPRALPLSEPGGPSLARIRLNDPKGGDMDEWPRDLRIRDLPFSRQTPELDLRTAII